MLQACDELWLWMLRVLPRDTRQQRTLVPLQLRGFCQGNSRTCVISDPSGCASALVNAPKPEALSQTSLHRSS